MASIKQLMSSFVFLLIFDLAHSQGRETKTSHNDQVIRCPDSKPIPCLPDFVCCTYAEYCSKKSHSCEPCFRGFTDQDALRECLKNPHFKGDGTCKFACYEKFPEEMGNRTLKGEEPRIEPSNKPREEPRIEDDKTPLTVYALIAIVIILALVIVSLCGYYNRNWLKRKPAVKDADKTCVKTVDNDNVTVHALAHSRESLGINRRPTDLPQKSISTEIVLDVNRHPTEQATEDVPLLDRNVDAQPTEDLSGRCHDYQADAAAPAPRPFYMCISPTNSSEEARSAVVTSADRGIRNV